MTLLMTILYVFSILTFALYAWDKHLAVFGKFRIPEFVLLLFSVLFGGFGALCSMIFFKHKTKHQLFVISVPILACLQIAVIVIVNVFF